MAELSAQGRANAPATPRPVTSALMVLAGAALFGTVGTAQALGPEVPAESLAAARMLTTGVLLLLFASATRRAPVVLTAARQTPAWIAGFGQGGFNLCFLAAMKEAGVAVGTLVAIGATPVVTGLVTRHVSRRWALATAVAVAGLTVLVLGQQGTPTAASPWGVLLALGAAASYATYIVAGNAAEARGLETQSFLAAAFSVAAMVTLPWLLLGDLGWAASRDGALLLGYLVLVPTILAYSFFNRGLRGVRSSAASTLALVEPVVAASLAVMVLGEQLSPVGLLGVGMVLLGLLLIVRSAADQHTGTGLRAGSGGGQGRASDGAASDVPIRPVG